MDTMRRNEVLPDEQSQPVEVETESEELFLPEEIVLQQKLQKLTPRLDHMVPD